MHCRKIMITNKKNPNLRFQVYNNLIISFLKLVSLFSGIAKACMSSSQGNINLHHINQLKKIHNQWLIKKLRIKSKKKNNNKVTKTPKKGLMSPSWSTFKFLWNYSKDKITESWLRYKIEALTMLQVFAKRVFKAWVLIIIISPIIVTRHIVRWWF